jgi:peroxiredoxin
MDHPASQHQARRLLLKAGFVTGLGLLAGPLLLAGRSAQAQSTALAALSPAQRELTAPELPALGSVLRLPDTALLDGGAFNAAQSLGQITVVYWWSSTCPFCAQQSPEMEKLWQAYQGKGLQFLALSVDKKPQDAQAYLLKKGYTFPSAWVSPEVHKVLPKPKGLPITLVLGRDGRVLQAEKGQLFAEDVAELSDWLK